MQFLFMVLMAVIVGASAFPHALQTRQRPSFSMHKETAFSLVAIPKFLKKVVNLERTASSSKTKKASNSESSNNSKLDPRARSLASESEDISDDDSADSEIVAPNFILQKSSLTSCVCQSNHSVSCLLTVSGSCVGSESPVFFIDNQMQEGTPVKELPCRGDNTFSGEFALKGSGSMRVVFENA